jgi:mannitol-specific phosphotransferase system IIBC component
MKIKALFLLLLLGVCELAVPSYGQTLLNQVQDGVTLQNAATATGVGAPLDVAGYSVTAVEVTISNTATVTFQGLINATWVNLACAPLGGGATATAATATDFTAAAAGVEGHLQTRTTAARAARERTASRSLSQFSRRSYAEISLCDRSLGGAAHGAGIFRGKRYLPNHRRHDHGRGPDSNALHGVGYGRGRRRLQQRRHRRLHGFAESVLDQDQK